MEFLNLPVNDIKKAKKDDLLDCVLQLKGNVMTGSDFASLIEVIKEVQKDMKELKDELFRLKEENIALKNQSSEEQLENLKVENSRLDQHNRRNNIEISGVPDIFSDNLEGKIIEICNELDVKVTEQDIEACHRLPGKKSPKKVIVRFVNRKNVEKLLKNKKNAIDLEKLGFGKESKLYFNENLCSYKRRIWGMCRNLKAKGMLKYVWTLHGTVLIKRDDSSANRAIDKESLLFDLFPDFDFSS